MNNSNKVCVFAAFILFLLFLVIPTILYVTTTETKVITVDYKYTRYSSSNGPQMIVNSGNDCYEVHNDLIIWRTDADQVFSGLKEGTTYTVQTMGWSIPFMGVYPNIIKVE